MQIDRYVGTGSSSHVHDPTPFDLGSNMFGGCGIHGCLKKNRFFCIVGMPCMLKINEHCPPTTQDLMLPYAKG